MPINTISMRRYLKWYFFAYIGHHVISASLPCVFSSSCDSLSYFNLTLFSSTFLGTHEIIVCKRDFEERVKRWGKITNLRDSIFSPSYLYGNYRFFYVIIVFIPRLIYFFFSLNFFFINTFFSNIDFIK
jgi:hypothetical protein